MFYMYAGDGGGGGDGNEFCSSSYSLLSFKSVYSVFQFGQNLIYFSAKGRITRSAVSFHLTAACLRLSPLITSANAVPLRRHGVYGFSFSVYDFALRQRRLGSRILFLT